MTALRHVAFSLSIVCPQTVAMKNSAQPLDGSNASENSGDSTAPKPGANRGQPSEFFFVGFYYIVLILFCSMVMIPYMAIYSSYALLSIGFLFRRRFATQVIASIVFLWSLFGILMEYRSTLP